MKDKEKILPMDPDAREGGRPADSAPRHRNTYGMDRLISEVEMLFPGIGYKTEDRSERGVAFAVRFDLSTVLPEDRTDFSTLLYLLGDPAHNRDDRVVGIAADAESVTVYFRRDPRIMDLRDPFGLDGAWRVLHESDDEPVHLLDQFGDSQ